MNMMIHRHHRFRSGLRFRSAGGFAGWPAGGAGAGGGVAEHDLGGFVAYEAMHVGFGGWG